jgi:hypothetical protein
MTRIVGLMISCMKYQGTYTKFKVKYNKKEALRSIIPMGDETTTLEVDSAEEEQEEVWVKVEEKSYVITVHNQDTWQGTFRTLVPLAATSIHSSMLLRNVQHCCPSFRRNEEEINKYN